METHNALVIPKGDVLDVYPGSQFPDLVQRGLANLLQIPENKYAHNRSIKSDLQVS